MRNHYTGMSTIATSGVVNSIADQFDPWNHSNELSLPTQIAATLASQSGKSYYSHCAVQEMKINNLTPSTTKAMSNKGLDRRIFSN